MQFSCVLATSSSGIAHTHLWNRRLKIWRDVYHPVARMRYHERSERLSNNFHVVWRSFKNSYIISLLGNPYTKDSGTYPHRNSLHKTLSILHPL